MNELDIRNQAAVAFDGLRKSQTAKGAELESIQIASLVAAEKLVTQVLVDLNRVATALEVMVDIADKRMPQP